MEGEIYNFIVIWITVFVSLNYCHIIGKFIPKGTRRFLAILPIICLFFILPLNLTSMHLCGMTSFFIAWLANFKLIIFAFGKGPLSSDPPIPLLHFIPMACLPIKIVSTPSKPSINGNPSSKPSINENPSQKITQKGQKSVWNYSIKILLMGLLMNVYKYHEFLHPQLKMSLYCFHMYFILEIMLAMVGSVTRALVRVELEPQFDEPYLSTSLQDFWGKRWNLMVTNILRPTIYVPVRSLSKGLIPSKWASLVAVFATFLVSGVMHELIFYYTGRLKPTGEVTFFFLIHGVLLGIEIVIKRSLNGKFRLPAIVSGPMTLGFVMATSFWFFFPPYLRSKSDIRSCQETVAFSKFVMHGRLLSSSEVSCPYF